MCSMRNCVLFCIIHVFLIFRWSSSRTLLPVRFLQVNKIFTFLLVFFLTCKIFFMKYEPFLIMCEKCAKFTAIENCMWKTVHNMQNRFYWPWSHNVIVSYSSELLWIFRMKQFLPGNKEEEKEEVDEFGPSR